MPTPTPYFENSLVSVSAHPAGYAQLTYYTAPFAPDELQAALQHTGDLLQRRGWHRLLEDQRQLAPLTAEQQEVVTSYWHHQTRTLSQPLCVATVLAHDVFARLAAATLRHALRTATIDYRLFLDPLAASAWLRRQVGCPPHK